MYCPIENKSTLNSGILALCLHVFAPCRSWRRSEEQMSFRFLNQRKIWQKFFPVFTLHLKSRPILILTQKDLSFMIRNILGDSKVQRGKGRVLPMGERCAGKPGRLTHAHGAWWGLLPTSQQGQANVATLWSHLSAQTVKHRLSGILWTDLLWRELRTYSFRHTKLFKNITITIEMKMC